MSSNHDHIKNNPRWKAVRLECFDRDDYTCVDCGSTEQLQADHEVPLAVLFAGGVDAEAIEAALDLDNLRTRCRTCNLAKGATTDAVVIRHTWVSPRYPIVSWIADEDVMTQDDTPKASPVL